MGVVTIHSKEIIIFTLFLTTLLINTAYAAIDDFEDGDYTNNPTWTVYTGTPTINTNIVRNGTYSINTKSTDRVGILNPDSSTSGTKNFQFWINAQAPGGNTSYLILKQQDDATNCNFGTSNEIEMYYKRSSGRIGYFKYTNGVLAQSFVAGLTDSNWYLVKTSFNYTLQKMDINVFGYNGTTNLYSSGNLDFNYQLPIYRTCLLGNDNNAFFDDVTYSSLIGNQVNVSVFRKNSSSHLSNFFMDCNVNAYDQNANSPAAFDMNTGVYNCNFSRTGYDSNNGIIITSPEAGTTTVYLADSTAPIIGQTNATGFSINGTQIWGTGTISATASDAGSDINSSACEYTVNNGATWLNADKNATHCYKSGITIAAGTTYDFNIRARDNANNLGYGTKTVTYTADNVAPTLGTTSLNAFSIGGAYIKGTGNISATITDAVSGVNTTQCEYTINNGATWLTADGNATHCYKNSITVSNGVTYDFNFRGKDLAGNQGYATKSATYTGDTIAPTTTFSYVLTADSNKATGTITCTDSGSGCKTITYKIDSGDWNYVTTTTSLVFDYRNVGHHTVSFYGTDNADTNETTNTNDLNMPVRLTVLYPKNEATAVQITEHWELDVTGTFNFSYSNLSADQNIYLPQNTTMTLTIVDTNGNYFSRTYTKDYNGFVSTDTLQPYLVSTTTGLLTTINTIDALTLIPVPDIALKIYLNSPTLGRTLVEELTTDDKGQALALLVLNSSYDFEIYQNSVLLRTDAITATSNTIYIKIPVSSGLDRNFTYYSINPLFNPARSKLITSDTNLRQTITLTNNGTSVVTISSVLIWATNEDINGINNNDRNLYLHLFASPVNPFTNGITINNTTKTIDGNAYDINGALNVYVYVTLSDGNTFLYFYKYSLPGVKSIKEGLSIDVKGFFGCSTSDPLMPCGGLLLVSLFLALIFTIGLAIEVGATNMESMGIMFLAFMGLFTFFEWVPYLLYGLMIITFVVIEVAIGGNRI